MNILYHFRTQGTGAEGVHIAGLASAFEALGHRLTFSSPTGVDPRRTAGANPFGETHWRSVLGRLAAIAPPLLFELIEICYNGVAWWRHRRLLDRGPCDLIYERHAFFLFATALLAQRRGIPLVVEVNELAGDERLRASPRLAALARWADRATFTRATLIVVVSPHLQRRIAGLGVPSERILVLPNAVSESALTACADPLAIRRLYGCENALVVGFVGWFVAWHRLENLLAQFAPLTPATPHLRLWLVGDGDLRAPLADLARQLGIADRVIFTGAVPHTEVPAHLAAMEICVVPHSNDYRSPLKLFEAMAHAGSVLAPRTEPISMVLRDGENGLLFDPNDPTDLRARLASLIGNPALRERLGKQARADIARAHTWQHNAQAVLARLRLPAPQHAS